MTSKLRAAFLMTAPKHWTGRTSYLQNLLEAIRQCAAPVEVCLLIQGKPDSLPWGDYDTFVKKYSLREYPRGVRFVNRVVSRLLGYDVLLARALRMIPGGVDLIFPKDYYVEPQTATLYWIPDFQHVHLPEMFTADDIRSRDLGFRLGIRRATLTVLSSRDAQKDFCRFAPDYADKARVMSFVAYVPRWVYSTSPRSVVVHHGLPERFFYLPNQYWKHKNHMIVLEALQMLKERGVRPFVVCTGIPGDPRNPAHFDELVKKISHWDLQDQIALLGLVPREDVFLLIRQSICVINPSLFEGWSTSVEEAKSIGKRVLLSDLAVHREQDPPMATYFDPHSSEDLADRMAETWADATSGPDLELEHRAQSELPMRMQRYAATFVSIARDAVGIARGR